MLCNFVVDVAALGELVDDALQGASLAVQPGGQSHDGSLGASQLSELRRAAAGLTDLDDITGLDEVRGDVDLLAVDGEVSVRDQLTSVAAGLSKAQTEHDVVQTALHELEQVLTGLAGHSLSLQVSVVELLLQNAVDELDLLLLLHARYTIGSDWKNLDGLNYLEGKTLDFVDEKAYLGTVAAHVDGGVPVITMDCGELNDRKVGELFYFLELCCGVSAYILDVNPFNQPGVELYKRNMFQLLGKPGYEK